MEVIGTTINNFKIDRLIGDGSVGDTYQARDLFREKNVAFKIIHERFANRSDFRERFTNQVHAASKLDHPGFVKVYDFGQYKDLFYVVMEYVPGVNLRNLLDELIAKRKWLPLNQALLVVEQLCETVEYAGRRGVLYQDIEPANLILKPELEKDDPFQIVLTDLGLRALIGDRGAPAYMSPEQALGQATDSRSAVYSLGVLLYELTVGLLPFPVKTAQEAVLHHTKEQPPAPRSILPNLSTGLEQVILKALEKEPDRRYPNPAELGVDLAGMTSDVTAFINVGDNNEAGLSEKAAPSQASHTTVVEESRTDQTEVEQDSASGSQEPQHTISIRLEFKRKSQTLEFQSDTVTIGRDQDNEIMLDDSKVSRQHARIVWNGSSYQVYDLKSRNGVYMQGKRLPPEVPNVWNPRHQIRIGGATLQLIDPTISLEHPKAVVEDFGGGREPVLVSPQQIMMEAGGSATASISLFNTRSKPDRFYLSLTGIPNEWILNLPAYVDLAPGTQKEIPLTLQIPRDPQSRAGRHPMTLLVTSQRDAKPIADIKLTLTIAAYSQFRAELHPPRLQIGQVGNLIISNQGNVQETFNVAILDDRGEISFQPSQVQVRVKEGESTASTYRAQLRWPRWWGSEKRHAFSAQISPPRGEPQILRAEAISRGAVPAWTPVVFLSLCFLLAGFLSILILPQFLVLATPTLTPSPIATLTASVTPNPRAPTVEEWCVYLRDQPPLTPTDCKVQVTAMPGQSITIRWRVSNATQVLIEPIGSQNLSGNTSSGSADFLVTANLTAITLMAENADGAVEKRTQIIVMTPAVAVQTQRETPTMTMTSNSQPEAPNLEEWCVYPEGNPPADLLNCPINLQVKLGQKLIVQWKVSNVNGVVVDISNDSSTYPSSGILEYTTLEIGSKKFTLRATNAAQSLQRSIEVIIVSPPPTTPPPTITPPLPNPTTTMNPQTPPTPSFTPCPTETSMPALTPTPTETSIPTPTETPTPMPTNCP